MNDPVEKKCETCLDGFYGPPWRSECEACQDIRTTFPSLMRWVVGVIDRRVKAAIAEVTATPRCDTCGCRPSMIFTTGKGTFCQEHMKT